MPGNPSASRRRSTAGVITPRSSAISGSSRRAGQIASRGVERRPPGPTPPAAGQRVAGAARHRPVRHEAAEVVDPGDVVELERAPQALGPPAVAAALERGPVVERVAPQLALVGVGVGRRARDRVVGEQLRMRAVVDRAGRDVDRHVADQPHAARLGVLAQGGPLAVEPHLVGDRAARAEARPVVDPERVALAEVELGRPSRPARAGRPAGPARPRTPTPTCTASRGGRAARAAASATTTALRRRASRRTRAPRARAVPDGSEVGWSWTPLVRGRFIEGRCRILPLGVPAPKRRRTPGQDPDQLPRADGRRWTLPGQAHGRRHGPRSPPTSSATATRSCARSCATRRPAPAAGWRRRCTRSTRTSTASAGRASSRSRPRAAGSGRSRPGATCSAPGATSCSASTPPGRTDLARRDLRGRRDARGRRRPRRRRARTAPRSSARSTR